MPSDFALAPAREPEQRRRLGERLRETLGAVFRPEFVLARACQRRPTPDRASSPPPLDFTQTINLAGGSSTPRSSTA